MHLSMMFLWAFALVLHVHAAPRPGHEDTTSSSTHVYSSATPTGSPSHPHSIIHVYSSTTHSASPSHHSFLSPTCHPNIKSYLIKVEHESLKEFTYLIYTPPDHSSSISYPFGSIGDTILKPDTFAAIFWIYCGDLKNGNASLAQYYKAYPHHHPPSAEDAEYYFIIIGESAPVGISHHLPANVGYKKFGTNEYGDLTFAGLQKWAVCSPTTKDTAKTKYVYWLGDGECPDNCIMDVTLKLVPYGFPFEHDYYHGHTKSTHGESTYSHETCSTAGYETSSSSCAPTYTPPAISGHHGGESSSCEETSTSSHSYGGGKGVHASSVGSHPYTSSESCSDSESSPKSTYTSSKTWTPSNTYPKSTKYTSSETCTESGTHTSPVYTSSETCSESDTHPTPPVYPSSKTCSESENSPTSTYTSSETCTESDTHPISPVYASSETCTESHTHSTHPIYTSSETCSDMETSPTSTVHGGSHHSSYYPDEYEECDDDDYSYYSHYYHHHPPTPTTSECTSSTTPSSAKVYLTSTAKTGVVHYSKSVVSSSKPKVAAY